MKRWLYGGTALVPMAVPTSWRKCLSMNERLLFFRIVSSNTPIVWGLGVLGGRVLACNFMKCNTYFMSSSCGMLAVTKIVFSGRGGRDSRSCRKCLLSWMYEGSISTRGCRGVHMLILLVEVVYWACVPWEIIEEWSTCGL